MKKLSRNSIATTLGVVIFILIGLDLFIWERTKNFLVDEIKQELSLNVALARKIIDLNSFYKKDKSELKNFSNIIRQTTGLRTTLMSKDGEVLADSELDINNLNEVENHINRPEVQQSLETGTGFNRRHSATINKDLLYYCENLHQEKRVVGFIRFAMFATSLDNKMNFLTQLLLVVDLFVLFAVGIFLFAYNRYFQNRIKNFVSRLNNIREENNFTELEPQEYFEFDLIAGSVNTFGNIFKSRINDLQGDNTELHRIFNSMKEGIAAFDFDGRLLFSNLAFKKVLNLKGEIAPLVYFYDLIHFPPIINDINEFLKTKINLVNKTKYPGNIYINYSITPMLIKNDTYHGFVISFEDVTHLHNLEIIRKDFVANVSHEFKTPLTSIKGYTETLLSGTVTDKNIETKFLNKILNQSKHLENIISDLIQLSRIENEETREMEKINVAVVAAELAEDFHVHCEARDITFNFQNNVGDNVLVNGSNHLIQTLLSNLLINAVKYSNEDGLIEFQLSEKDKHVIIDIIDTGVGIPEKEQARVFERFYRTEKSREIYPEGSGLGLSIVKNITELIGGEIKLESKKHKGSKFTIILPIIN